MDLRRRLENQFDYSELPTNKLVQVLYYMLPAGRLYISTGDTLPVTDEGINSLSGGSLSLVDRTIHEKISSISYQISRR